MASTIILSDNGASSGSAGLKQTAGNDGVLILQTTTSGGTATNAIYVDNTQQVGLGTTSPGAKLEVYGSTYGKIKINGGTGGELLLTSAGTDVGDIYANSTLVNVSSLTSVPLIFGTNSTERARFNAGAPILCLSGGNTSATGTGIAFPATQSASSDVNTLDDYEEGSWTPVISGSASVSGQSYVAQKGLYVKVGKLVTVTLDVGLSAKGTMTGGNVVITGLPFVPNQYNAGGVANGSAFGYFGTLATSYIWVGWECDYGNSLMYLTGKTAAGISVSFLDPTNISDNTRFATSFSYITT